jgi:hypothetical protein
MNDDRLEELIRKAVQDDKEPDFDKMWSKIKYKTEVVGHTRKSFHRKGWFKVAALISVILIVFIIVGSTARIGETFPFLFPFHRLVRQVINNTQSLFQFDLKEQDIPDDISVPPVIEEEKAIGTDFIESDLDTIKSIYPDTLFYPGGISKDTLQKIEYYKHDFLWVIIMDFKVNGSNVVFIQQDFPTGGVSGKSFDTDDTNVSFYRSGGVEYMIAEMRYNIVQITWVMEDKQFDLSANLPVETVLEIAQSVEPMVFDSK